MLVRLLTLLPLLQVVVANTEKSIFTAKIQSANIDFNAGFPDIGFLAPDKQTLWRISLPVAFPSIDAPRGIEYWLPLYNLKDGARYEVRLCWAAISPTDFWLEAFSADDLIKLGIAEPGTVVKQPVSNMYLRIQGAATYYSSNQTLMKSPTPVLVDLILDEYLLGLLPASLLGVGVFILIVATVAWFLGIYLARWLAVDILRPCGKVKSL